MMSSSLLKTYNSHEYQSLNSDFPFLLKKNYYHLDRSKGKRIKMSHDKHSFTSCCPTKAIIKKYVHMSINS